MPYTIHPLRYAHCQAVDSAMFADSSAREPLSPLALYVWVIEGGPAPVIVDPGPDKAGLEWFSREVAHLCPGGVIEERDMLQAVREAGVDPEEVEWVIITHIHYDHFAGIHHFPNARVVVSRRGLLEAIAPADGSRPYLPREFMDQMARRWPQGIHPAQDEEELYPGLRVRWIGGHSPCDQAVLVETEDGVVALPGDTVMLYRNMEENRPVGIGETADCVAAMAVLRDVADVILPSHDPKVGERYSERVS